jgi:hypothetical protein
VLFKLNSILSINPKVNFDALDKKFSKHSVHVSFVFFKSHKCLHGLNIVKNGKVLERTEFEDLDTFFPVVGELEGA